jgi:hypothetical protein
MDKVVVTAHKINMAVLQYMFHIHAPKTLIATGEKKKKSNYIMIKSSIHSFIHEILEVQPIKLKSPSFFCTAPQHGVNKPPVITGYLHIPPILVREDRSFLLLQAISSSTTISNTLPARVLYLHHQHLL